MLNRKLIGLFITSFALIGASLYWRSLTVEVSLNQVARTIENNIGQVEQEIDIDAVGVLQAVSDSLPWPNSRFIFHLFDSSTLVRWNSDEPVPDGLLASDSLTLLNNGGSYFLGKRYLTKSQRFVIVGFIELEKRYPIKNRYLDNSSNQTIFPVDNLTISQDGSGEVVTYQQSVLFNISPQSDAIKINYASWVGWLLLGFGSVLLLYAAWITANNVRHGGYPFWGAAIVFLALFMLRLVMVYGGYPGKLNGIDAFDPAQFASSTFNDSIGNLFLNSLAFLVAAVVMFMWAGHAQLKMQKTSLRVRVLGSVVCLLLAFGFHLLPFMYVETLFFSPRINLDIARQLYFDTVRWFAYGCVILSHFTGFFYFFAFYRMAQAFTGRKGLMFSVIVFVSLALMLVYQIIMEREFEIPLVIAAVHLLILYWGLSLERLKLRSSTLVVAFLALGMFCVQAALTYQLASIKRDVRAMKRYANSFLVSRDVLAEYLLMQSASSIEQDAFIQQQFTNLFGRLNNISHKIKRSHMSSYFDRYEVKVYLYDLKGAPLSNDNIPHLDTLKTGLTSINKESSTNLVWQNVQTGAQNSYTVIVPIKASVSGFVVVTATLRELSPITVFPRLLLDDRFSHYAYQANLSYAVYRNGYLQYSSGVFKYELYKFNQHLDEPSLFRTGFETDGFLHLGIEDIDGRVVVVTTTAYTPFNLLTNFCFLFLVGLLICSLGFAAREWAVKRNSPLPYSVRIQLFVYLAFILPIVIIGITTLRLNSVSEQDHAEIENMQKATRLAQNLGDFMIENTGSLQQELQVQTRGIGVDATVFSTSGTLVATSQPEIYSSYISGRLLHPNVLDEIGKGNFLFTLDDQVEKLKFKATYAAIRSPQSGSVIGVLSIPFFEAQQAGEENQLRLASNIWVVVALVFIFFYLASFVALSWLTKPLQIIAASLRKTTLTGTNRKLSWRSRDEIGSMVNEYNKLIDNLEVSKAELARKQREAAWREMARQVAHEIKNPLTPIKLTLQQMEMAMLRDKDNQEKNIQSIKTVLHQVDILNEIASSFSAFAQMPEIKLERANIALLIQETVSLYHNTKPHLIVWEFPEQPIWVMADSQLFVRIFGNIILNAFQAGETESVTVVIGIKKINNTVRINFSDNGLGMSPEVVDKVFIPYFSTKETGSGLGLAIARQGVDQAGGRIWCESSLGKGTTFFIELPVIS